MGEGRAGKPGRAEMGASSLRSGATGPAAVASQERVGLQRSSLEKQLGGPPASTYFRSKDARHVQRRTEGSTQGVPSWSAHTCT